MRDSKSTRERERDATRVTKEEWGRRGGRERGMNESERGNERKRERERCDSSN